MPDIVLNVWFFDASQDKRSNWINNMVTRLDPPFCHCEVQFPCHTACCIYMDGSVLLRKREYDPLTYQCIAVKTNKTRLEKAWLFANDLHKKKVKFSTWAMIGSYIHALHGLSDSGKCDSTCCSQLTADILNITCDFGFVSRECTPSGIYKRLMNEQQGYRHQIPRLMTSVNEDGSCAQAIDFKD